MAYNVVDPIELPPTISAASSYTITLSTLGLTLVDDDYLIVGIQCSATSGTLSTASSGWSEQSELDITSGCRMAVYSVKVASGTAADLTVSLSAGSGLWQAFICQVRDADATTLLDGLTATDHGNVTSATTGTMTPGSNNCLVMYFAGLRFASGTDNPMRFLSVDVVGQITETIDDGSVYPTMVMGTVQQTTAAATAKTFYNTALGRSGSIVFAIKNKTSGQINKHGFSDASRVTWLGNFGATHDGLTWAAPDNGGTTWDGSGNINSIAVSGTGATRDDAISGYEPWGTFTSFASTVNTASAWVGSKATLAAPKDFTGKIFSIEFLMPQNFSQLGTEGIIIAFLDASGYWKAFQLSQKLGLTGNKPLFAAIAVETATAYASGGGGSIDWSGVVSLTFLYHRAGSSGTSRTMLFRNAMLLGASTLVGGNATRPVKIVFLDRVLNGWGYQNLCANLGTAIQQKSKVQIGNGSFPTYFDASATLNNFPDAYDKLTSRETQITADALELRVLASSSDTINLTACGVVAPLEQTLIFDPTSSTSATYSTAGASVSGMAVTWLAGVPCSDITFKNCPVIAFAGSTLTNVIANTGTGTAVMSASDGFSDTNGTYTASTTAVYGIRIAAAGTFGLDGTTFSGFTKDLDVTAASGTVTVNLADGTSTPTYQTAGATVTFVSSPVYQTVTLTGFTAGSRIWIKDVTSSTVLFNGTASAGDTVISGSSCVWTDSSVAAADRQIAIRVAYVSTVTAKAFLDVADIGTCGQAAGSQSIAYIVAQTADTTYNSNAIDGSTVADVTFTDAATDLVNCNLAGGSTTYPRVYAAFVYWMFTSNGIDDDNTYIDAPDTANYLFTAMKVRNTSATPLTITGGYGRDATSGLVADIIDVAGSTGNIYPEPDHVVAYQTTGTYAITGDISTVITSIGTVPQAVWEYTLP